MYKKSKEYISSYLIKVILKILKTGSEYTKDGLAPVRAGNSQ